MNSKGRIFIRLAEYEKKNLQKQAEKYGYSITEYVKRKLFHENNDFNQESAIYISPETNKHNLLSISLLYKILYFAKESLLSRGCDIDEIEGRSLDYARKQRELQGYRVEKNNE